jgi:hypothetical protein
MGKDKTMKAMVATMEVIKKKAQDDMEIPETDVNRATRLLDTLMAIGTEDIDIEIILDPLNHEGRRDRFIRRLQKTRAQMKKDTKKETKAFRRRSAREQRQKEQKMMDGTKKGLLPALYNETKYTRVKDHVIRDKDGELIVGKQAMLDRLMEHCEEVNNTTNTHPLDPGETVEQRKEWMHAPEVQHMWYERQKTERENAKLAKEKITDKEWKDFMRRQKCVSCPEDGFQGALLAAIYAGADSQDLNSSVLMTYRAAANYQLRKQLVLPEKKKCDIVMAPKPGKDPREGKSYRPITCCTVMFQLVTGTFLTRLMKPLMDSPAWSTGQTAEAQGVCMLDTSIAIENVRALAKLTCTPLIRMFSDKRSAFNYINHEAVMDAAKCYGWGQCDMMQDMHKDIQYRIRMSGVGVTEYSKQTKGVVQGSRIGSQIYAMTENMFTMWVAKTTKGFQCSVPRRDGSKIRVQIHTQTHMDDTADMASTEEGAEDMAKKRYKAARHYHHPFAAEKGIVMATDAYGNANMSLRIEAWEGTNKSSTTPSMPNNDTTGYTHGGIELNIEGAGPTDEKAMNQVEKTMQKIQNSRATSPMATYATNAQCIGALKYKAALGTITEETG